MTLDTRALVREATRLAPLPQAALRLVSILSREDWEAAEVLEVVRLDPVLTGKVLGAANSTASGAQAKILNLEEAVRRIGPRAVAGLALAGGIKGRLSLALPQFGLGEGELWRHSVAALLAAEYAGVHFQIPNSTAAITAALLHDVGKVLLARFLDPDTLEYMRLARVGGRESARAAEIEILAISHAELGAMIAVHWGLPAEIACVVQYHDDLGNVPEASRRDAALVLLADSTAKVVDPPKIRPDDEPLELAAAQAILGVAPEGFPDFCNAVKTRYRKIGAAY